MLEQEQKFLDAIKRVFLPDQVEADPVRRAAYLDCVRLPSSAAVCERMTMSNAPSTKKNEQSEIPSVQEFCVSIPLYNKYDVSKCTEQEIYLEFEYFSGAIDAYCLDCRRDSVFRAHLSDRKVQGLKKASGSGQVFGMGVSTPVLKGSKPPAPHPIEAATASPDVSQVKKSTEIHHDDRDFDLEFRCTRQQSHRLRFYFSIKGNNICKVGQYPSLADLHKGDISKYRAILKDKYPELVRAINLHAHDVGIGSFVYLRRVFEHLVYKAREAASQDTGWDEQAFHKARMSEKIKLLTNHLPDFMIENANIFGILSTGIHELTEDECLTYFATVEMGIRLILDEEISRKEREANIKTTKNEIARITGEI